MVKSPMPKQLRRPLRRLRHGVLHPMPKRRLTMFRFGNMAITENTKRGLKQQTWM
jgi:hypothetical protein